MTPAADELTRLRAENRVLREELEEWRRSDAVDDEEIVADWRLKLSLTPQAVRTLRLLMASPGRFVPRLVIHNEISFKGEHPNLVSVNVHRVRACLAKRGLTKAVLSAWGHGYKITPEAAAKIREMVK